MACDYISSYLTMTADEATQHVVSASLQQQ